MKASDTVLFLLVCAAASFSHPDEELCQSGGEHGRRGKSDIIFISLDARGWSLLVLTAVVYLLDS